MSQLTACSSVYYLYQAGKGQLKILNRARPVSEVIADSTTDPKLAEILTKIPEIKSYGETHGLKPTKNYSSYVSLDEDAVSYVVTISDELQFKPKVFSFPIVGSFTYLGWFHLDDAKKFASEFEKQGFDVNVRGASAYSTLGWFRDPLLSSMIPKEDNGKVSEEALPELVNVFLHESVHATIYLSNQSNFNENLAVFVSDKMTAHYFKDKNLEKTAGYVSYLSLKEHYEKVKERLTKLHSDLKQLYDSSKSVEDKRQEKAKLISEAETELKLKKHLNNASLIQFETYHSSLVDFETVYQALGQDLGKFLVAMAGLKDSDFPGAQTESYRDVLMKTLK